ncbi:hypothetical protein BY458DRAFT_560071 [Sporodiniella umbellata]|nr:hypothetical protein BY458DRAFT_560071 [Sporodiniella umbellata]
MDYLIKTKIGSWKMENLYSHYKQNFNNSQDAQAKLKSDLNDLINSELTSDRAKKFLKSLLERSKIRLQTIENKIYQSDIEEEEEEEGITSEPLHVPVNKLEYLEGGEMEVQIDDTTDNVVLWYIEDLNVSKNFHEYRSYCIKKLSITQVFPSYTEELALNGIMWIDERNRRSYKLSEEIWKLVSLQLKNKYKKNYTKPKEYKEIEKIAEKIMTEGVQEGEDQAEKYQAYCASMGLKTELLRANKTHDMINKLKQNNLAAIKEPLFCSLVVDNLVAPFLCSNGVDVILQGSSDPSTASKERRGSHGRVPDLSLIIKHNDYIAMPFLCEVKSPSHMQGLSQKDLQKPDLVKLANIMKDELDLMDMIEEKKVYGLLIEGIYGFKCQLFVMDLSYYKVYRFFMIDQFYLPRDLSDLHTLVPCFRRLDFLEETMIETANKILDNFSRLLPNEGITTPSRCPNGKLVSFRSPHRNN